jgi:hypothetical protein
VEGVKLFDLATTPLREVNRYLHRDAVGAGVKRVKILNADGAHSIAAGLAAQGVVVVAGFIAHQKDGFALFLAFSHGSITSRFERLGLKAQQN